MAVCLARGVAGTIAVIGIVLAAFAVRGIVGMGASLAEMLASYGLTNLLIGASLAATGTVLAFARPSIVIGWLFQAAGICYLLSAAALSSLPWPGHPRVVDALPTPIAAAFYYASWPLAIGILLPLALLAFPEGRLRGPVNRAVAAVICTTGLAFWAAFGLVPGEGPARNAVGLPVEVYAGLAPLWEVANLGNLASWLAVAIVLTLRLLRGDETVKRRMLWLVLAILASLSLTVPFTVFGLGDVGMLAAIVLIPVGVMVGVLRHRLLDIRLAVARTLVWLLLAGIVLAVDLMLVGVLTPVIASDGGPAAVAVAALLVAIAAEPVRRLLQRGIDRLVFGRRSTAVVARLMRDRIAGAADAAELVEGLRQVLGVAGLCFEVEGLGTIARSGTLASGVERLTLSVRSETVGALLVGVRRGDEGLRRADRSTLAIVEPVLGVLAQSLQLSAALRDSRARIVEAAERERVRLQRDLHDGVASALSGVQFKVEAARASLSDRSPAGPVLDDAAHDLRHVLASLRFVIEDLRPPELDRIGLAAALRDRWIRAIGRDGATVAIRIEAELPEALPAAIEAAAYRIAVEATTNALRHSDAHAIRISLRQADDAIVLVVTDDGGHAGLWREGTGMRSMRERAEELGGACAIVADGTGVVVEARLPFPALIADAEPILEGQLHG